MCTNFSSAGIPGTRLKVCGGVVVVGGSHTHYCITPVPRLGAGALMLNAWTGLLLRCTIVTHLFVNLVTLGWLRLKLCREHSCWVTSAIRSKFVDPGSNNCIMWCVVYIYASSHGGLFSQYYALCWLIIIFFLFVFRGPKAKNVRIDYTVTEPICGSAKH